MILENLKNLLATDTPVWIRIPIIPTVNDTEEEIQQFKDYIFSCGKPEKIELLPYHAMGEHKYAALGKEAQMFSVPSEEKMKHLNNIFNIIEVILGWPTRSFGIFHTILQENSTNFLANSIYIV